MFSRCVVVGLLGCASCAAPDLPARWAEPVTDMQCVLIPDGGFVMGLTGAEDTLRPAPAHEVRITHAFFLGESEVTQRQWQQVMGTSPGYFGECGADCPVESVSWHDVQEYLKRLTALNPGERFRLPTEAEWEYACRAGSHARYGTGSGALNPDIANYDPRIGSAAPNTAQSRDRPIPVASFPPNAWGLYDMAGNVWEWTASEFCPYSPSPEIDPRPRCGTDTVVIRGGSWAFSATAASCGHRYTHARQDSGYSLGFRVVREIRH